MPTFTSIEIITNLTQYELCQEEADLLKACLYFSIQPDKIRKSEIITTFGKINRSFINNLKSEETKNHIKGHLSYLANSYFYNYKPSPHIRNLRKNKDIVITKPDERNGVVILDRKLYDNAIKQTISDTSKFEKLNGDPNLKIYMINCILLVLLLLISMLLLKCTGFHLVTHPLNFVRLFHLYVLLTMILPVSIVISFHQ